MSRAPGRGREATLTENELDVRQLRKPDKHPTIFASYGWEYVQNGPAAWPIRITKLAETPV